MARPFDEALDELIDSYIVGAADVDELIDELISVLKLKILALKEDQRATRDNGDET